MISNLIYDIDKQIYIIYKEKLGYSAAPLTLFCENHATEKNRRQEPIKIYLRTIGGGGGVEMFNVQSILQARYDILLKKPRKISINIANEPSTSFG